MQDFFLVLQLSLQSIYPLQFNSNTATMIIKLTSILLFAFVALIFALLLYPPYIKFLERIKAGKKIREADVTGNDATIFKRLHKHK